MINLLNDNILRGVKPQSNGQYSAFCPVCEPDKSRGNGHLYFKHDGSKWLFYCQKGCGFDSICAALNIDTKDLFADSQPKNQQWQFIREHVYTDENNAPIGKKEILRKPDGDKTAIWYKYTPDGYVRGLDGMKMPLYHLPELINTFDETVYVVEGEKDVETMKRLGFTATTTPNGAGQAKIPNGCIKYFANKNVIIIHDNDEAGIKFAEIIQNTLRKRCKSVTVVDPVKIYSELAEKGDISDIVQAIGEDETKTRLSEAVEMARNYDLYQRKYIYKDDDGKHKISAPLLTKYFQDNEQYLLAKGEDISDEYIYLYRNGCYRYIGANELKGIFKSMIPLTLQSKKTLDEAYGLLIADYDNSTAIGKLNTDENIINFKNGLLYLDTMELKEHTPNVLSTIQIDCNYNPNAKKPKDSHFEKFMDFFTESNEEVRRFLIQYIGMAISNVHGYRTKKSLFMVGKGDTGKTQLKELCVRLIGQKYTSGVDLQTLEERFGTSNIYNKRLVGSNDMGFLSIKELRSFKLLTGGDSINIEFKNKTAFPYTFKGVMWFCCNELPRFGGDKGQHVYDRIIPLRCDNVVPENMRDPQLLDKLYSEREYVIKLCVDGLKQVIDNKYRYDLPIKVSGALRQYQHSNDSVLQFFDECCEPRINGVIDDHITKGMVYKYYKAWSQLNNGGYSEKNADFNKTLIDNKMGETKKTNGGNEFYISFKIKQSAVAEYGSLL